MLKVPKIVLSLLFLSAVYGPVCAEMTATTEKGEKVILREDGTWRFREPFPAKGINPKASAKIEMLRGKAVVYYRPDRWQGLKEAQPGRYELTHRDGDVNGLVIAERLQMPLDTLRSVALNNAREASSDIKVVREERRVVNGQEVLFLQLEGTISGIPIVFMGYYYSGTAGAVQIVAYTGQNLLKEYQADMLEFLGGFTVIQK